ncbi:hypothetical protein PHYPO_G00113620 [Pangasianodon hypophthalmus]|uniref:Uncharacterized protein n=1 Tax=Pangasianodon hypophthalmus TaxID=310915 RepID=A0A5N5L3D4_PANHP|nr:hypothetical protein PHYPO_G00113620 [Pangasianodon hypophthalmus]
MERPAAEVMEQFPFLGVPQLMLHEMTMRFGTDLVTTEGLVRNAALILLPALFKENASFLYCVDSEHKGPTPTIVFNGSPDPLKAESVSIIMDNIT